MNADDPRHFHHERERLAPPMRAAMESMDYDPLDVHPGQFLLGGQAW